MTGSRLAAFRGRKQFQDKEKGRNERVSSGNARMKCGMVVVLTNGPKSTFIGLEKGYCVCCVKERNDQLLLWVPHV